MEVKKSAISRYLPEENPLWKAEILRSEAALDAHNLEAMKKNRLSLSICAYPLQSEGFTLRWVMGLEKIINNAINLRLFFNLFKKYTFIFNKCKVM